MRGGGEKEAKLIGLMPYPVLCRHFRATLCHKSFEISLIRIFTNSSDPVDKNLVLVQNCQLKNLVLVQIVAIKNPVLVQKAVEKFG